MGTFLPGGQRTQPPRGWFDCGAILFPAASPPDIHQGGTHFWDNTLRTNDGKTYLALVVREDDSWESISQKVMGTLKEGKCYQFSIHLAKSNSYMSHTTRDKTNKTNFSQPAVFRLWGGTSTCDLKELLAESETVDHNKWKEYKFKIEPSNDYTHVTLEAFFKTPVLMGYNGHVCLDNASSFRIISCDDEEPLYAEMTRPTPAPKAKKVKPSIKKKKKKVVEFDRGSKEQKVDTIAYERPRNPDLDIEKLNIGSLIKLEELYFHADTTTINVASLVELNDVYEFLDEHKEICIEVGGHTSSECSEDYCNTLSTNRAKAVAKYLIKKGVDDKRVTYKGYGKKRPIATNATPSGRKKNRRVQILITRLEYANGDGEGDG